MQPCSYLGRPLFIIFSMNLVAFAAFFWRQLNKIVKRSPKFVVFFSFFFLFARSYFNFSHSSGSYAGHKQEVTPTDNQIRPTTAN